MKKTVSLILFLAILVMSAACVAEGAGIAADQIKGVWYINVVVDNGTAYDVSQVPNPSIIEFNTDNTGYYYLQGDENNKSAVAWTVDANNNLWFTDENTQESRSITILPDPNNDGEFYLQIANDTTQYILSRKLAETVNFASFVKAESEADFDGHYALTYLCGNGFTMKAANALEDLSTLGIKTTEITIDTSLVELFGNDPRAYVFNEEDGTLNMEIEENIDFLNIHILKTETGIAINWLDMTFYADPV